MQKLRNNFLIWLLIAVLAGFSLGRLVERQQLKVDFSGRVPKVEVVKKEVGKPQTVDFSLFWDVWARVYRDYLDKAVLDPKKMVYGAISGMVRALGDPYTVFLPPEENKEIKQELGGRFEGVGIQIGFRDSRLAVIAPLKDTPADRAGILAGDLILAIDGKDTTGISLPEAQRLIRGPKGSQVTLKILHEGARDPVDIDITRGTILVKSVDWEVRDGVVILKIIRFSDRTNREWDKAISNIKYQISNIRGVVLDVRDNPGGYLSGAIFVASEFLKGGVVVRQEKADGTKQDFRVERRGKLLNIPLVVLINRGSASASEIIAGALQERGRAKLVGEKTFGKGTIQEVQELPGGAGLHITTARWLLPSGRSVEKEGLEPDFGVKVTKEDIETERDPVLEKAMEILGTRD